MSSLVQQLSASGLAERIIDGGRLADLLRGSSARRYGLVNRALKNGSLLRLKRDTYMLAHPYRRSPAHPFAIAQALVPGSYVSFESALAHHGWIPEAVYVTAGVSPGRKSLNFDVPGFGRYEYSPLAILNFGFLVGVDRVSFDPLVAFVAQPLRALMDLVALRKVEWSGLAWLTDGMRIEPDTLRSLRREDFVALEPVYRHRAVNAFLAALKDEVMRMKASA